MEQKLEGQVTIKCLIQPEDFPHSFTVSLSASVDIVKSRIASSLNRSPEDLTLVFQNRAIQNAQTDKTLTEIGLEESKTYEVQVFTEDIKESKTFERIKKVTRHKSKKTKPKTFDGGFRHRVNGTLFLNSGVQCYDHVLKGEALLENERFSRDTQTVTVKTISSQSSKPKATQMKRKDLYIDDSNLKTLIPRKYFSYDQLLEVRTKVCLRLQCFYRIIKAKRVLRRLQRKKAMKKSVIANHKTKAKLEKYDKFKREQERKRFPTTFADFRRIKTDLNVWKTKALKKSQKKEHVNILKTETKVLRNLEETKRLRQEEKRAESEMNLLKFMAKNKKWKGRGGVISVETPDTRRAKDLLITHNTLKQGGVQEETETPEEFQKRWLECIVKAKWLIKSNKAKTLTKKRVDLLKLLDREADLLSRRRSSRSRRQLRKRISKQFYELCLCKEFNPEAENIQLN